MATTYGVGSQSPTALSRPIERVFEDAQHTGEIQLSGRKLREYPKLAAKYDLVDTISTDLSKNRLGEVPKDVCTYGSMEKLNCYHNVIKSVPVALVQLQALTHLNLSRNQLSIIPSFISQLHQLEVLLASHNHLVSLPEEIGVLDKLMELDVSCNEISHLPMQIGDLKSLKSLNVRRNLLVELPIEISKLNLRKLDFSGNRISKIPTHFRKIETLEEIILDHNPLTLPPAYVCTKGRQHIMKFLQIEAIKEDKKRGILNDVEMKRYRKSLPPQQSVSSEEFGNFLESPENKWKRHTVLSSDSGYSTTDEKSGYSPQETSNGSAHVDEATSLAARTAAPVREPRYQPARGPLSQHWATRERISPEKPQIFPEKPQQYIVARGHNSPSLDQSRISPEKPQTPPKPQILSGKPQSYSVTRGRNSPSVEKSPISEKLPYYPPPENLPPYSVTKPHFPGAQPPMTAHPTMPHSQTQSTFTGTQHTTGQPTFNGSQHSQTQQGQPHFIGSQHTQGQPNYTGSQHTQGQSNYTGSQHTQGQPNFTGSQHTQGQPNFTGSQHTQGQPNVTGSQHQHTQEQPNLTGSQQSPRQPTLHSYHQQSQEPQIVTSPQTQYPPSPLSPQTPTTPQGPGPGAEITTGPAPSDDAFTRELQRQKYEYESKKKLAEQIRRQQEEEDEREQRRRAAQRVQDEQRALLDRQREEATHAQEQARLREEQRQHESAEATRLEEAQRLYEESQRAEEARRQEEQCLLEQRQSQEESRQHRSEHNYYHGSVNSNYNNSNSAWMPPPPPSMLAGSPTSPRSEHGPQYVAYSNSMVDPFTNYSLNNYRKPVQSSNSFKEDRRNISGPQPYRRTVSDSNQRLPVHRPPPQQSSDSLTRPSYPIKNGPIEEASVNGSPGLRTSTEPAADTSFTSDTSTPPHNDMTHINGTSVDINRPTTPQSTVVRRTKVTDRVQSAPTTSSASKVSKLTERHGRATTASTTTRTGVPSARKNHLTAEEELRRSQQSTKVCPSTDTQKVRNRADDQRLRTLQKESATSYLNRRSTGSTSSEDDKKRSTPTRSLAYSATPGKRTGAGNATQSNVPRSTTTSARTTQPTRATTNARTAGSVTTTSGAQSRRTANLGRSTISGSSSSLASNTSATSKSKRAGQVMTNAQVKALEAYKDADANYTMRRQDQGHHDGLEQLDILRKTISTRLKRTLPDNLSEALSDGVLLCHLANQIRPRSVASVHVPSPAVPKLTPAKCRRNVDNFLEACRKIGVNRDQICASSDIIEGKGVGKVAITVAALVAMATHAKHAAIV